MGKKDKKRKAESAPPVVEEEEEIIEDEVERDSDSDDDDDDDELVPLTMSAGGGVFEDVDDDEDDSEGEEKKDDEVVDVDFEFVDPKEIHFHSVSRLLAKYIPDVPVSDLVDAIIEQVSLGTMIQINEDVDVYGFATVLPVHVFKGRECMKAITKFLLSSCPSSDKKELQSVLQDRHSGLLVHERMVNMPPQIASPLFDALLKDIEWSLTQETDEKVKDCYRFKQFLLIAPCDLSSGETTKGVDDSGKKRKKARVEEEIYFHRFEDEIFKSLSTSCFTVKMEQTEADIAKGNPPQYKAVMVLPVSAIKESIKMIKTMLGE